MCSPATIYRFKQPFRHHRPARRPVPATIYRFKQPFHKPHDVINFSRITCNHLPVQAAVSTRRWQWRNHPGVHLQPSTGSSSRFHHLDSTGDLSRVLPATIYRFKQPFPQAHRQGWSPVHHPATIYRFKQPFPPARGRKIHRGAKPATIYRFKQPFPLQVARPTGIGRPLQPSTGSSSRFHASGGSTDAPGWVLQPSTGSSSRFHGHADPAGRDHIHHLQPSTGSSSRFHSVARAVAASRVPATIYRFKQPFPPPHLGRSRGVGLTLQPSTGSSSRFHGWGKFTSRITYLRSALRAPLDPPRESGFPQWGCSQLLRTLFSFQTS